MASKQKTNQTVQMATLEQLRQLIAIMVQAIPVRITYAQAQHWIGHARELAAKIRGIFAVADPYHELLAAWERFYRDTFSWHFMDLSRLVVPPKPDGSYRLIVVVPGITIEQVLTAYAAKDIKVWRWTNDNLDAITDSDRSAAAGPYAIWVRDTQEAHLEHAGKSYDQLKTVGVPGMTLLERLILELVYFLETGKHLDVTNVTLCSGSLYHVGHVPLVYFSAGKVRVCWCNRFSAFGLLRCREAVV